MKSRGIIFLFMFGLFFLISKPSMSQFYLDILYNGVPTDTVHICFGSPLDISANGSANFLMNNNFNNMTLGAGWSSTAANPVFTNPCQCPFSGGSPPATCASGVPGQIGPNGAFAWVGTTASATRTLETNSYQLLQFALGGCKVEWWMMYGITPNDGACEDPDASNEGVHLQYSLNNGATWTDFPGPNVNPVGNTSPTPPFITSVPGSGGYWTPQSALAQQLTSTLYFWNKYSVMVPSVAYSNNTKFRWAQLATSSTGYDAWGIDEVEITCPTLPFVEWRHLFNGSDSIFWSGMDSTALNPPPMYSLMSGVHYFIVTLVDLNTGNSLSDTLTAFVHDPYAISINNGISPQVCIGVPATLNAVGTNVVSYQWSNGATTQSTTVSPLITTPYSIIGTDNHGCFLYDTLDVIVHQNPIIQTVSDTICVGDTAELTASGGASYVWSNGATQPTIHVSPSITTTYQVIVKSTENCVDSAQVTAKVNPLPVVTLTPDATICEGNNIQLTAGGGVKYLWNTNDTTPQITVSPLTQTTYSVHVTDLNGCENDASMKVSVIPNPIASITVESDTICKGEQAILTAYGGSSYIWSNGSTLSSIKVHPTTTTTYAVIAENTLNGTTCTDTASATQFVKICNMIYFPTAINPTGYNREFKPIGEFSKSTSYYWAIYNRWGEKIFETTDTEAVWNGTYKGEIVPVGVYVFYFKMVNSINETYEKTGTVTVLN